MRLTRADMRRFKGSRLVDPFGHACPDCGAPAGKKCRNYAGGGKATCLIRHVPPALLEAQGHRPATVLRQGNLPGLEPGR